MRKRFANSCRQEGFTLIEILAVMVILSVLAAVAIKKYIFIESTAQRKAIAAGVAELNSQEALTWTNHMFSAGGYQDDNTVWTAMSVDTFLGPEYNWSGAPSDAGGTLVFAGQSVSLTRTASDSTTPAKWTM